jgi:hypothetical protein
MQDAPPTSENASALSGALHHIQDFHTLKVTDVNFMPQAVFKLQALRRLTFSRVPESVTLPDCISQLTNLHTLSIQDWKLQELPWSICNLTRLKELSLYSTNVHDFPNDISKMGLTSLCLELCDCLKELPRSVCGLQTLSSLNLSDCYQLENLSEISRLTKLTYLNLCRCKSLRSLPDALFEEINLLHLCLNECSGLNQLPDSFLKLSPLCVLDFRGSGFSKEYRFSPVEVDALLQAIVLQRRMQMLKRMFSWLNNWAAYNNSLQHMSLISVLLATAAFVAFAQTPSQADVFARPGLEPAYPEAWIRAFFIADQITFVLAMAVVMLVQLCVSSLPFDKSGGEHNRAYRVWRQHLLLTSLLSAAVLSGILSFFFAGAAVYPHEHVRTDMLPLVISCMTIVAMIAWQWATTMHRMHPYPSEFFLMLGIPRFWIVTHSWYGE